MRAVITFGTCFGALLAPTLVVAHSPLDAAIPTAFLICMLFIALASPTLWRGAQIALLPAIVISPLVVLYGLQVGAMPGEDVITALRLSNWQELQELLVDMGVGGLVAVGGVLLMVLFVCLAPPLRPTGPARQRLLLLGVAYIAAGLIHYSFLREFVLVKPWVSQEVVLDTYPFSLLQPLSSVAMAVPNVSSRSPVRMIAADAEDASQLVVLVIGESARADHWHINGYMRQTTPLVEAIENVVSLGHVRAIADCTYSAVPAMLKMLGAREFSHSSQGAGVPALPDYFKAAGFFTAYLTMQEVRLVEESGVFTDYTRGVRALNPDSVTRDEMLLPELRRLLAMRVKKKFIVLHLFGSHFQYAQRYPPAFARFDGGDDVRQRRIAAYDNSLAYTDWLLSQVIDGMQNQPGEAILAYVSDHGENLMDDDRQLYRHCDQVTHYDTHVAALMWAKGLRRPKSWEWLKENRNRYVGQEMIGSSLLDLAGLEVERGGRVLPASFAREFNEPAVRYVLYKGGLVGFSKDGRSEWSDAH